MSRRPKKPTANKQTYEAASNASTASITVAMSEQGKLTALQKKMELYEEFFTSVKAIAVEKQLQIEDLHEQLEAVKAENLRLLQENKGLQLRQPAAQMNQLLNQVNLLNTSYADLYARFVKVSAINANYEDERAGKREKVTDLTQRNKQLQSRVLALTEAVTSLEQTNVSLTEQLAGANSPYIMEIMRLKAKFDILNFQLSETGYTMVQQFEVQNQGLQSRIQQLEVQSQELRSRIQQLDLQNQGPQLIRNNLDNAVSLSEAKFNKMHEEKVESEWESANLRPQIRYLRTTLSKERREHTRDVRKLKQKIDTLEAQQATAALVPAVSVASSITGNATSLFKSVSDAASMELSSDPLVGVDVSH
ncbi:MAG: hypothetical protein COB66_04435 [Coxiella sp. (in: Bacteria)]|nr:MAG: hypothetical protein COB66_04435 [Coxiella sp. (in: g-proteobacteria)]